jgi:tetratricopeptide (TPR) repeat protein
LKGLQGPGRQFLGWGNIVYRRYQADSNQQIGDILADLGDFAAAFEYYVAARIIVDRLAQTEQENLDWQRAVSVLQEKIGIVYLDQNNMADALQCYEASLAIRERLSAQEPGNSDYRLGLAATCGKVGRLYLMMKRPGEALGLFKKGRAMVVRATDPMSANLLAQFDEAIGELNENS